LLVEYVAPLFDLAFSEVELPRQRERRVKKPTSRDAIEVKYLVHETRSVPHEILVLREQQGLGVRRLGIKPVLDPASEHLEVVVDHPIDLPRQRLGVVLVWRSEHGMGQQFRRTRV